MMYLPNVWHLMWFVSNHRNIHPDSIQSMMMSDVVDDDDDDENKNEMLDDDIHVYDVDDGDHCYYDDVR